MIQVRCTKRISDDINGGYKYELEDSSGQHIILSAKQLKNEIISNRIRVSNLKLTKDNRLIYVKDTISDEKLIQLFNTAIQKGQLLGNFSPLIAINIPNSEKRIYLYSKKPIEHYLYVPDDVTILNFLEKNSGLGVVLNNNAKLFDEMRGYLKVLGGKNLTDVSYLFCNCKYCTLDLTSFDTRNIQNMKGMFLGAKINRLLMNMNTSKVEDMSYMFEQCKVKELNIKSFDTSRVTDMSNMFKECETKQIDISSFNTSNVKFMSQMFCFCRTKNIVLGTPNVENVRDMHMMFCDAKVNSLDINFNTKNLESASSMFAGLNLSKLNINMDTTSMEYCNGMFSHTKIKEPLDISSFSMDRVKHMMSMFMDFECPYVNLGKFRINKDVVHDKFKIGSKTKFKSENQNIPNLIELWYVQDLKDKERFGK